MSILVLGARMGTHPQIFSDLYGQKAVFIPKMPGLGLLLEEPLFDSYNQRMVAINEKFKPTDPDYRPPIDFNQYREEMNGFKERFIYKTMRQVEDQNGLFDAWIRAVDTYSGNDLLYLNPSGVLPDAAVITKGVRRENPFRERRVFDTTGFDGHHEIETKLEEDDDGAGIDKQHLEETEG